MAPPTTFPRTDEILPRMPSAMSSGTSSDATTSNTEGRTAAAASAVTTTNNTAASSSICRPVDVHPLMILPPPAPGTCCALEECTAPPDATPGNPHHCFFCGGDMHSPLWCGALFYQIRDAKGVEIDLRLFTPNKVLDLGSNPHQNCTKMMCHKCINLYTDETRRLQQEQLRLQQDQLLSNGLLRNAGDEIDETLLGQGAVAATGEGESPILHCTWQHVVTTTAACNYVIGKSGVQTRVKGFRVAGATIPIKDIKVDQLRSWCQGKTEKSGRKDKKEVLCNKILRYKGAMETKASQGLDGSADDSSDGGGSSTDSGCRLTINRKRLANVLFSDKVKPKYAQRGGGLDRAALQNGEKTDQKMVELIIDEYNNSDVDEYGKRAHDNVTWEKDASDFTPISRADWKKVLRVINSVNAEYEECVKRWTQSGNHDEFDSIMDNVDASTCSGHMQYIHAYMCANKDLYSVVMSRLPDGAFSESVSGAPNKGKGSNYVRRRDGSGKKGSGSSATDAALNSIKEKNEMMNQKMAIEMQSTLSKDMRDTDKYKRELVSDLEESIEGSKKEKRVQAKDRIDKFKKHKATKQNATADNDDALITSDDDDDESLYDESQETLIGQIVEQDEKYAKLKARKENLEKSLDVAKKKA